MTNTQIATPEDRELEVSAATSIIAVIERAALDPNVDIDKMERLLQMQERIIDRQARADFTAALAKMQPKLPIIGEKGKIKNKAGGVQSTYAKWEDINEAIRPFLHDHGFALNFRIEERPDEKIVVFAILSHQGGHSEETGSPPLMADTSGSKNAIQALGSSVSYGKRYTASAILNLTSRGEDDGGVAGGAGPTVSPEQFTKLRDMLEELGGSNEKLFLQNYGVPSLEQFPAAKFNDAEDLLKHKMKTKGAE
jgi:hypothetical protein